MPVNFHLQLIFFLHDFILIASVMGESVICHGHGIGGNAQLKWRNSLNASCCSKQQPSAITWSHNHSMRDGSEIQVRSNAMSYAEFLCRISTTSSIEVTYELLRYYEYLYTHSGTQIGSHTRLIIKIGSHTRPSSVTHARRLSYMQSHSRLMETHPSVTGIGNNRIV